MQRKRQLKRDSSFSDVDSAAEKETRKPKVNPQAIDEVTASETEDGDSQPAKPKEPITFKKVAVRLATGTLLAIIYFSIINAGHFYCILAVAVTQVSQLMYYLWYFIFHYIK